MFSDVVLLFARDHLLLGSDVNSLRLEPYSGIPFFVFYFFCFVRREREEGILKFICDGTVNR